LIPKSVHVLNEGVAFLLELLALAGLCWWGFHVGHSAAVHVLLGIGAPLAMVVVWGTFCAPRARVKLDLIPLLLVRGLVLLLAAAAVYDNGKSLAAYVFAAVIVANGVIAGLDREALINQR
jgi:hypothetical protein